MNIKRRYRGGRNSFGAIHAAAFTARGPEGTPAVPFQSNEFFRSLPSRALSKPDDCRRLTAGLDEFPVLDGNVLVAGLAVKAARVEDAADRGSAPGAFTLECAEADHGAGELDHRV